MRINWAVFGERNGGHALLASSGNSAFATLITQYTDRPGDPPVGLDWGPVDSGFYFAGHYILLRTLPDSTAGRAGMVLSSAAYVPEKELISLGNLAAIFRQLPKALIRPEASLDPLNIPDIVLSVTAETKVPGLISLARRLGSPNPALPLVWASTERYLPIIDALWARLPVALRPAFAFAFQFAPEHNLPVTPTLIATLPELAGRWPAEQLITAEATDPGNLNAAQRWFAGMSEGAEFSHILADYGIVVKEFRELNLLSVFADLIARLPELSFAEASKAVRIVEKYSKTNKVAAKGRPALFAKLCALVSAATPEEIARLRNLDAEALDDLIGPLSIAIKGWLRAATLSDKHVANIEMATDAPDSWWSKPFTAWLRALTPLPSVHEARTLCGLLASRKISRLVAGSLSDDAATEEKLLGGLPKKLDREHAKNMLQLAQDRGWTRLHAACLLRSRAETEAIMVHAEMAGEKTAGFRMLHEHFGFAPVLRAACAAGNKNLVQYAGAALHENGAVATNGMANKCKHWCSILTHAISQSTGKLRDPLRSFIVSTAEHPSVKAVGFTELWTACTDRDVTIWLELAAPAIALNQLDPDKRTEVVAKINAHIKAEIEALRHFEFAKPDGFREIVDVESVLQVLASVPPSDAAKAGVNAFRSISFLSDDDCCRWLIDLFTRTHYVKLQADDAREIASVLLAADYPKAAEIIRETAENYFRADVGPVFHEIRYKYQMANLYQSKPTVKTNRLPKVVIATALPLERSEVIKQLGTTEYDAQLFADIGIWPAEQPVFEVYVLATGAGNLEAQGAILRILKQRKPKFAFFVGVAGGLKDSRVGDVIYGTKVHYYEGGKEEEDGIKSRPVSERASEHLVQLAHRVAEKQWQPVDESQAATATKATPAIIASGEKVLASTLLQARTFRRIKEAYNDTQVVDMEAYGFLKACRDENVPHAMVIRGVSDKVAGKAESDAQGNQPLAAHNAAAFLFALLRSCSDILKPKKKKRKKILGIF
jgi:nucleoside phosphorylase